MSEPVCFTCSIGPAGNDYGGPYSAYCAGCQPRDRHPVPPGLSACQCAACGRDFTSTSAFDRHMASTVEVVCLDPASRGLVLTTRRAGGREWKLWGWPDSGRTGRPGR